jgi:hypothetical protein
LNKGHPFPFPIAPGGETEQGGGVYEGANILASMNVYYHIKSLQFQFTVTLTGLFFGKNVQKTAFQLGNSFF